MPESVRGEPLVLAYKGCRIQINNNSEYRYFMQQPKNLVDRISKNSH